MFDVTSLLAVGGKRQILGLDSGVFYKECTDCGETKQSKKFRLRAESKNHSRRPFCLPCEKNIRDSRYKENKNHHLQKTKKYQEENWIMKMLWQAKGSASRKNILFNSFASGNKFSVIVLI